MPSLEHLMGQKEEEAKVEWGKDGALNTNSSSHVFQPRKSVSQTQTVTLNQFCVRSSLCKHHPTKSSGRVRPSQSPSSLEVSRRQRDKFMSLSFFSSTAQETTTFFLSVCLWGKVIFMVFLPHSASLLQLTHESWPLPKNWAVSGLPLCVPKCEVWSTG